MQTSFYAPEELKSLGLKSYGENVLISRKASIYGAENISLGHDVRIDDFCILSGKIEIGNYVHIAAYTSLYGGSFGIIMKDFSSLSSRCTVYAVTDDFSGAALIGPIIPEEFRNITGDTVIFEKYVNIATGCTILPGVRMAEGSSVAAMSLVHKSLKEWGCYFGVPCMWVKERRKDLLTFAEKLEKN